MINTSTLRPGLLVSLKTSVRGNVSYQRRDIVPEHMTQDGAAESKWETERTIADVAEHEAAVKTRTKVTVAIRRACSHTAFGLLCPEDKVELLEDGIAEARAVVDAFNAEARITRVEFYVIKGRIAPDDVAAVKAINSEVRDLLSDMEQGLKNLDVKVVREAANKAKSIGSMLSDNAAARIQIAIDAARASAKQIVKAGEQASIEIDRLAIKKIVAQRTAFLDLDDAKEVATPKAKARAVDLEAVK